MDNPLCLKNSKTDFNKLPANSKEESMIQKLYEFDDKNPVKSTFDSNKKSDTEISNILKDYIDMRIGQLEDKLSFFNTNNLKLNLSYSQLNSIKSLPQVSNINSKKESLNVS